MANSPSVTLLALMKSKGMGLAFTVSPGLPLVGLTTTEAWTEPAIGRTPCLRMENSQRSTLEAGTTRLGQRTRFLGTEEDWPVRRVTVMLGGAISMSSPASLWITRRPARLSAALAAGVLAYETRYLQGTGGWRRRQVGPCVQGGRHKTHAPTSTKKCSL